MNNCTTNGTESPGNSLTASEDSKRQTEKAQDSLDNNG